MSQEKILRREWLRKRCLKVKGRKERIKIDYYFLGKILITVGKIIWAPGTEISLFPCVSHCP